MIIVQKRVQKEKRIEIFRSECFGIVNTLLFSACEKRTLLNDEGYVITQRYLEIRNLPTLVY